MVSVNVAAFRKGSAVNTLPAGALQTDQGQNADPASAIITTAKPNCCKKEDSHRGRSERNAYFGARAWPVPALISPVIISEPVVNAIVPVNNVTPIKVSTDIKKPMQPEDSSISMNPFTKTEQQESSNGCSTTGQSDILMGMSLITYFCLVLSRRRSR